MVDRMEIVYEVEQADGQRVKTEFDDDALKATTIKKIASDNYRSEMVMDLQGGLVTQVEIFVKNLKSQKDQQTTFKIIVFQEFAGEVEEDLFLGLFDIDMNSDAVMVILIATIASVCMCSICCFICYRRRQMAEYGLTETEERYVAVMDIRKQIRKAEAQSRRNPDMKREHQKRKKEFEAKLDELKEKQVKEFMEVLEKVHSYQHSTEEFKHI